MILFYAYGSGLGHLNRILSYIKVRALEFSSCIIMTNSTYKTFLPKEIKTMYYPDSFFKNQILFFETLLQIIKQFNVRELVVDVFPSGFYGELHNLDVIKIKKTILARILKPFYFDKYASPQYDDLVVLEKGIMLEHYNFSKTVSVPIKEGFIFSKQEINLQIPFFFILHSGPEEEVIQLYRLAQLYRKNSEHIYIQTFSKMQKLKDENVTFIFSERPIFSLLHASTKIFTACGFNTFYATQNYRQKQFFLPFKRTFDDQFKRKKYNSIA
ncbi:hypothetical protein [Aquimarina algicola]|uniref:Glycosyl transferase family 28 C-terminal domain-containing protein n=1 Tax=Aquimarina algicola TaxID=2589995 RepID=A0A504JGN8_9FLAO|nr:hypothetical protein [Aquimarina algicola]TPN85979.1 hypothetical protein FHK87_11905 [Aquimarina algicola]